MRYTDRAKSDLLANVSHDIRTLTNGIIGVNALLLGTELTEEQRSHAMLMRDSAEALLCLTNDVLDAAKLEAGRIEIESLDFDVLALLEDAAALLAPRAAERGLDLSVFVDPALGRGLRGDAMRLRQIVLNLISNAIKFTAHGGIAIKAIPTPAAIGATVVRFEVTDTGIGIAPDVQSRLFERFIQVDRTVARQYGGTGLGLAISRELVTLMGGRIGVDSRPGEGSVFWFEVPLAPAQMPLVETRTDIACLQGLRALVVGGTMLTLEMLSLQLRTLGLSVAAAGTPAAAIAEMEGSFVAGRPYDVVLADDLMPGVTGMDLLWRLRFSVGGPSVRIVMLTSARGSKLRSRAGELLNAVIEKPLRRAALVRCLASLFRIVPEPAETIPSPAAPVAANVLAEAASATRSLDILLAEDNRTNQYLVHWMLTKAGHAVTVVNNGVEALEAVREHGFDIVLMDAQMPVLDGPDAVRAIRVLKGPRRRVPIVALTADAMSGAREHYLAIGFDDYLSKPIRGQDLLQKLAASCPSATLLVD